MKSLIVLTRDDNPIAILTTKKALKRWMKINKYEFTSWTIAGETKHSEYRIEKMDLNDDDDPESIHVSYYNAVLTENASDRMMTWD